MVLSVVIFVLIIAAIVVVIFISSKKQKDRKQQKIVEEQEKQEIRKKEQEHAQKIANQQAELEKIKQAKQVEERRKQELEAKQKQEQVLLQQQSEIKQVFGKFPTLSYEIENQQDNYTISKHQISIGRQAQNDIVLQHPTVSRQHALIYFEQGTFYLKDLGSSNGSIINGRPITHQALQNGDLIEIGEVILHFYS